MNKEIEERKKTDTPTRWGRWWCAFPLILTNFQSERNPWHGREKKDRKRAVAHTNWPRELDICSRAGKYSYTRELNWPSESVACPLPRKTWQNYIKFTRRRNWPQPSLNVCPWKGRRGILETISKVYSRKNNN